MRREFWSYLLGDKFRDFSCSNDMFFQNRFIYFEFDICLTAKIRYYTLLVKLALYLEEGGMLLWWKRKIVGAAAASYLRKRNKGEGMKSLRTFVGCMLRPYAVRLAKD